MTKRSVPSLLRHILIMTTSKWNERKEETKRLASVEIRDSNINTDVVEVAQSTHYKAFYTQNSYPLLCIAPHPQMSFKSNDMSDRLSGVSLSGNSSSGVSQPGTDNDGGELDDWSAEEEETLTEAEKRILKKALDKAADLVHHMRTIDNDTDNFPPGVHCTAFDNTRRQFLQELLKISVMVSLDRDDEIRKKIVAFFEAAGCSENGQQYYVDWLCDCKSEPPTEEEVEMFLEASGPWYCQRQ